MKNQGIKVERKESQKVVHMQTVIKSPSGEPSSGAINWGDILGDIANQSDLITLFSGKQVTLVSGTNIKTINGTSLLGAGDITISGAGGDMLKSTYDTTNNGIVDNSERLGGELPAYYQSSGDKGIANGYASLDATAKVPLSQIPSSVIGALNYQGTRNASTNTPTLSDGSGSKGLYYVVTVAGSQNLGSGSITYDAGDWVVHNGTIRERLNDGDVTTVNGQSGVVTLTKTDIGLGNADNTSDATKNSAVTSITNKTSIGIGTSNTSYGLSIASSITSGVSVFNTADEVTNTERFGISWSSNILNLGTFFAGTGTLRAIRLGIGASAGATTLGRYLQISGSSDLFDFVDSTSSGTRVMLKSNLTSSASSGAPVLFNALLTSSQTGTAGWTMYGGNITGTDAGSGVKRLISLQVGSVDKFVVDSDGQIQSNSVAVPTISSISTLTNKTISLGSNTISGTIAQFNTAMTDGDIATLAGTETLTNKTINFSNNTISGTIAQFNTAVSDADLATLAGTETLTNKTLTAPRIANAGFIADANGNELLIFTTTASAVNELTIANGATANNPSITASGGDANIGINFVTKGTGVIGIKGNSTQAATLALYEDTDDGSNFSAFRASPRTTDITYLMPTGDPTAGQALTAGVPSSGVSQLSWTSVGGLGDIGAKATQSTGTTGSFGAYFALTFNTEEYDTNTFHDTATNNTRLTIPTGQTGTYMAVASVGNSANYRSIKIVKNGATDLSKNGVGSSTSISGADSGCFTTTWVGRLSAGDYIEAFCFSTSNTVTTTADTHFTIQRIA